MSMSLISWIVQPSIHYVGISVGTANMLFAIVLLKAGSLDFHIFLTPLKYYLETLTLLTLPTHDMFSSCPKCL